MNTGKVLSKVLTACLLLAGVSQSAAETIEISTPSTTLLLEATDGKPLYFTYYGSRLKESDIPGIASCAGTKTDAYPVYGLTNYCRETAMSVTHPDGNMTLDMAVDGISRSVADDGAGLTTITLNDKVYPFSIDVNYRTYPGCDIIETWVEAKNKGKKDILLREFASAYLPVRRGDVYLTSFYGAWANEAQMTEEPLTHGMVTIKNKDGVRNTHFAHSEVMFSLDGKPRENAGRVIGAALCYSGNYRLRIDSDESDYHHFFAGINEDNSSYRLGGGETFVTPPLALSYSTEGKGGVSRAFHKWGRKHRLANGDKDRKILLNSWEGVYFDINEAGMAQMMKDIADMGGELFVMDDGWFGRKYHRDNDKAALGDWVADTRKLPGGIDGLLDTAAKNNISFGIWLEPEMANTMSELYEKHPEYIIKPSNREAVTGRGGTQVVLDLGNPAVQDFVFNLVDTLLTNYPAIDYIKWDANASIMNHGSQYLPADKQSHLLIDYHRGLVKTLERIRAKYPDVTIQSCASGGGRVNYGILPWFDEFWVSDNTDALQRVYIQWGTSHFFPPLAMASHISAAQNHQTQRSVSLKYRIDVAMSGRLGMEIQPGNMSDEDKALCRNAIKEYKGIRHTVQHGDLYRLLSPFDKKGAASLMMVEPDKSKAVFFWWKTETFCNQQLPRVAMSGLDADRNYTVRELNRIDTEPLPFEGMTFSGKYLMTEGLEMPLTHKTPHDRQTPWSSRVLVLEAR